MALVSIIIPCFNTERWIGEAIESALAQTHREVEIIVVDDGSTDGSVARVKEYGNRVRLETGPNRGGNHARNRGVALSSGQYIQFLDADDYLLPEKIERQVACLEASGADVVYGDWRHQLHRPDGTHYFEPVVESGAPPDVLGALLAGWWVASAALLFRRGVVERVGGWDETLFAAQDRDFFTSVALAGAKMQYQPGCQTIYRRHGASVSTSKMRRWVENHGKVLDKAVAALRSSQRLSLEYRRGLARSYFYLARIYFDLDRSKYHETMTKLLALDPEFQPRESGMYNLTRRIMGFQGAELLASWKRRLAGRWLPANLKLRRITE